MSLRFPLRAALIALGLFAAVADLRANANHKYQPDEYVQIADGLSPDGKFSIRAHGEGDQGDDNFHLYLFDAGRGQKIGVLAEAKNNLDTAPEAFTAKWSPDSTSVIIYYRVDQHRLMAVRYGIENGQPVFRSPPKAH
jgi:hypothetical protein